MKSCIIHHLTAKQSLELNLYVLHTAPTKKKSMKTRTHVQTHTHYIHNSCIMLCHLISTYFTEVLILTSDLTDITLHCNIKCTSQVSRFSAEFFIHCTMLPAFYPLANKTLCFILVKYFYLHTEVFFNHSCKRLLQNISSTLSFFRQLKK